MTPLTETLPPKVTAKEEAAAHPHPQHGGRRRAQRPGKAPQSGPALKCTTEAERVSRRLLRQRMASCRRIIGNPY